MGIYLVKTKAFSAGYELSITVEQFDKDTKAKEKGRISVKFQDKDSNFSQNSEQPCQVHQN